MDRRAFVLACAGLSAAAGSAFAQSSPMGAMGDAERQHILDTLQVGTMSLRLSRTAVERAKEANVKQFAEFEVAEQETIGGILKPLASSAPPTDPQEAEIMKTLDSAGGDFDRDYVEAEIQGHDKLLQIQEAYLSVGKNPTQIDVAKLARGMIKEHLALLHGIEKGGMRG